MKGLPSYGWAFLVALLLHGALFLSLNAAVRFRAAQPPPKAGPISLQLLILPSPKTESKALQVRQSLAKPAAVLRPEAVREAVAEGVNPREPATIPTPEPPPQASQATEEAVGELNSPASEPETIEREASMETGANGAPSLAVAAPVISRDVVFEARPLSAIDPLFPIGSRIRGEQGDVRIQLWISADGRLERIQLLQTSGYTALDDAAERAITKTRFAPRRVNGNRVPGTLTILVRFQLDR